MPQWNRRFQQTEMSLGRVEAFSDGVIAIIVTLLVLELKVPQIHAVESVAELAAALLKLLPKFLSWVASFLYVCVFWVNHHHVLKQARRADAGLVWLNNLFLLCHSFLPFPAALLGDYPHNPLALSFFGIVLAVNGLAIINLHRYVAKNLLRDDLEPYVAEKDTPDEL